MDTAIQITGVNLKHTVVSHYYNIAVAVVLVYGYGGRKRRNTKGCEWCEKPLIKIFRACSMTFQCIVENKLNMFNVLIFYELYFFVILHVSLKTLKFAVPGAIGSLLKGDLCTEQSTTHEHVTYIWHRGYICVLLFIYLCIWEKSCNVKRYINVVHGMDYILRALKKIRKYSCSSLRWDNVRL